MSCADKVNTLLLTNRKKAIIIIHGAEVYLDTDKIREHIKYTHMILYPWF